jgi:hypothetical protein
MVKPTLGIILSQPLLPKIGILFIKSQFQCIVILLVFTAELDLMSLKRAKVLLSLFGCGGAQSLVVLNRPSRVSVLGFPFVVVDQRVKVD